MAAVVVLVPVLVALALWAFAWPAARTAPRDLPLGVAGSATAAAPVEKQLAQQDGRLRDPPLRRRGRRPGRHRGPDRIRRDRRHRAGPEAAHRVRGEPARRPAAPAGGGRAGPGGHERATVDVVPAPEDDPRGAALTSSVLPMALAGRGRGCRRDPARAARASRAVGRWSARPSSSAWWPPRSRTAGSAPSPANWWARPAR